MKILRKKDCEEPCLAYSSMIWFNLFALFDCKSTQFLNMPVCD